MTRRLLISVSCIALVACGQGPKETAVDAAAVAPTAGDARSEPTSPPPQGSAQTTETGAVASSEADPAPVVEQEFVYGATKDRNLVGFFVASADIIEPLPGVILIHDRWGLNDDVRDAARRLAGQGYAVLALDLYGGERPTTPEEAEILMGRVLADRDGTLANVHQAYDYLDRYALAPRIATLGWQLGAGWSLEAALELAGQIDAVVMYYGDVETDESRLDMLSAPLLGVFAENDEVVPLHRVQEFRRTLRELGKSAEVYVYSDVGHAFANHGERSYDAEAAEDAWTKTVAFLDAELKR